MRSRRSVSDGVRIETALFTNLTRDHLDYHADMRDYFESKARLFLECRSVAQHHQHRLRICRATRSALRVRRNGCVSTDVDRAADVRPYVFARSVAAHNSGFDVDVQSSFWGDGQLQPSQCPATSMLPTRCWRSRCCCTRVSLLTLPASALSSGNGTAGTHAGVDGPRGACGLCRLRAHARCH